ncbi:MAG: hypothetical protein HN405_03895 [Planctomycetes bacterium]|jgi:hypothetical protein|nr:hypothetical protein [Planctomycetota bacterium]MBT4029867.1 hypothetical protein [Planctomycetota bacterium]MBT4559945.1 hypothetical protein [Planctomycetota bacterium]MBT5102219.1 hypothetical protein [Planctomycetota bacterium]MBT7012934.1 hypothetical protein [Planctomycetota bacterium]
MRNLLLVAATALAVAPLAAQTSAEYVCYGGQPGTTNWEIRRTVDIDQNGSYLDAAEGPRFAFDDMVVVTYIESMEFGTVGNVPALYAVAGGDLILRMVDLDGDGLAMSAGEVLTYVDTRAAMGVSNTSPDDLVFDSNKVLYVTDDNWSTVPQPGSGIHAYIDLNGNGNCNDAGESSSFVDAATGTITLNESAGPVTIDLGDFEAITIDSNDVLIAFAQQDRALYAFKDLNGDGDAMDAGECWNFCNLVGDKAGLDINVDVAAGTLYNPSCVSSSGTGLYATLESLDVDLGAGPGGADIYWIVSNASPNSCAGANGLIYRGLDLNADGDLNDAGEVTLFFDAPNSSNMDYPANSIYSAAAHDGGIAFWSNTGPAGPNWPQNNVEFVWDDNNDGDGMDTGETATTWRWDPDGCYVKSMTTVPVGAFSAPAAASFTTFGQGGVSSGGTIPSIGNVGLPVLGSTFDVTVEFGPSNKPTVLFVGFSNTSYNRPPAFNLPLDMTFYGMPGNFLLTSIDYEFPNNTNGSGQAAMTLAIPNSASLAGMDVYFQWYMVDPAANSRGAVMSNGGHGVLN